MKLLASLTIGILSLGAANTVSASLVAHWGFDEIDGPIAYNSVGSINGTLFGGATFATTSGIVKGAIQITDGYVNMGNHYPSSSTFSIQAWVKTNPGDTSGMVPVGKHWAGIAQGYFLAINNIQDGHTQTNTEGFYSANGHYQTAVGGPPVTNGLWHQLVGVYNNGATSIYVDGNFAGSGSAGYSNNSADFMIGGIFNYSGVPVNAFNGLIDEVKIFDNALDAVDVKALYNNTVNPVPIPSAFWLFGAGLVGLVSGRIKTKR